MDIPGAIKEVFEFLNGVFKKKREKDELEDSMEPEEYASRGLFGRARSAFYRRRKLRQQREKDSSGSR